MTPRHTWGDWSELQQTRPRSWKHVDMGKVPRERCGDLGPPTARAWGPTHLLLLPVHLAQRPTQSMGWVLGRGASDPFSGSSQGESRARGLRKEGTGGRDTYGASPPPPLAPYKGPNLSLLREAETRWSIRPLTLASSVATEASAKACRLLPLLPMSPAVITLTEGGSGRWDVL